MTTLYVAGPMSGLPEYNYPAFRAAAAELTAAGYRVLDPSRIDEATGTEPGSKPWDWYMRQALRLLLAADHVATLPGWRKSKGARIEVDLAAKLGMGEAPVDSWINEAAS